MWQPGWEGGLGESAYMYMYGWVPSLFTWNYHNTVNQLYANTKLKKKPKKLGGLRQQNYFSQFSRLKVWNPGVHGAICSRGGRLPSLSLDLQIFDVPWVWSLGQEDSLEEGMATRSSTVASEIPWREEPRLYYSLQGRKESDTTGVT